MEEHCSTVTPPSKNLEFPPLSQRPRTNCMMPLNNPVDQFIPEKFTPLEPGQDEESRPKKDLSDVIPKTEEILNVGYRQVKHAKAITMEFKLLLEHEQKLLQQVITRIDKFKKLRDENKQKALDWENEYKSKLPEYENYATKLVNVPQTKPITVEGLPAPIQQKILYQIVSRTSNTADRVVVSLSMEQTVANDIDLTLGSLKKHCTVILKRIRGWLKMLETHECQQNVVLERFDKYKQTIKDMKTHAEARTVTVMGSSTNISLIKSYEERIKKLESQMCRMGQSEFCEGDGKKGKGDDTGKGGKKPAVNGADRLNRIEQTLCQLANNSFQFCSQTGPKPRPAAVVQSSKEARLARIEELLCKMAPKSGICSKAPSSNDERLKRIEDALCYLPNPNNVTLPFCQGPGPKTPGRPPSPDCPPCPASGPTSSPTSQQGYCEAYQQPRECCEQSYFDSCVPDQALINY